LKKSAAISYTAFVE